ncbi:MAG: hypothetical protein GOVbin1573_32 [Prokaryotic dsDNA virus sp.]|nr:MAG: hypothetical protein GOVbin1573_32 [Prokaryotic dsDNA virus sp.]|tara:strand:- start:793 stop:948 length:156 start_codon:yes stop_codon:yes gene_type:complete
MDRTPEEIAEGYRLLGEALKLLGMNPGEPEGRYTRRLDGALLALRLSPPRA